MIEALNPLRELTIPSIFLRFLLALCFSAIIGYERRKSRHEAGLRTHAIVCMGAASVMILSQYLSLYLNSNADPARLGAQVISGIGFLGAGSIIVIGQRERQRVKGLTTAAGLWASACMGLIIGSGFFEAATIMYIFLICVIILMNSIQHKHLNISTVRLYLEYTAEMPFSRILIILRKNGWKLSHYECYPRGNNQLNSIMIEIKEIEKGTIPTQLLADLRSAPEILFVEEDLEKI